MGNAANAAAVVAGFGIYSADRSTVPVFLCLSIACWLAGVFFRVRVAIDEELFRALAEHPEDGGAQLDELLGAWKLAAAAKPRSIRKRVEGALRLWRIQAALLVAQLILLAIVFVGHL